MDVTQAIVDGRRGKILLEKDGKILISFGKGEMQYCEPDAVQVLRYLDREKFLLYLYSLMSRLQREENWDASLEIGLLIRRIEEGAFDVME